MRYAEIVHEKWSKKYKSSINCNNPKGFSQKAHCAGRKKNEELEEGKRIPRKKGQPAGSKKHSDLYTDENPKGTIHGLKFATVKDAQASVSKIRNSGKKHAHKIQAAVAMEQRAKAAGKTSAAAVYRKYINAMKKKTKAKNEDIEENFADGKKKGKSRPGRVKRSGASCKGSVTSLRAKAKKASGERAKMYHWCANMKSGRKK